MVLCLGPAPAHAQLGEVPVIEAGREQEVLALFAPYGLGDEVRPGWRLSDVRIEQTRIVARLAGPDEAEVEVRLEHPDEAEDARAETRSFAVGWQGEAEAARAVAEAVARNDRGRFWRMQARVRPDPEQALAWSRGSRAWVFDGTLWLLVGLVLLLGLVRRQLEDAPRGAPAVLAACTLAGAAYRVWLAPETMLGAWPYSRTVPLVRSIWEGPGLATLSSWSGPIEYFDFATTLTLLFALVTPLAVFAHARALLGDGRAAVAAAVVVAALPVHVRFSHSEVEFVPSIVLSSLTFALIHTAVKDRNALWRAVAAVGTPLVAAGTFVTRPLNLLFVPLFLLAAVAMHRDARPPRGRRVLLSVLVLVAATASVALHFVHYYSDQVREGASPQVLVQALEAFFSLRWNTLIHPGITPPVLLLLAVLGAWWWWRRDRRLVVFLSGWLAAFFVTHAYVLPQQPAMQARYHLHLVAPFVLLAALGAVELLRRNRRAGAFALACVVVAPLLHADFVTDVAFGDQREYAFVRRTQPLVPEGCTVLEHTGPGTGDHDARYGRLGAVLDGFVERRRWPVQPMGAPEGSPDPLRPEARAALEAGGCVYYYEGIPCWSTRAPGEPIARACAAMRALLPLDLVASERFENRFYDGNLDPRVPEVELRLYRVTPPRPR